MCLIPEPNRVKSNFWSLSVEIFHHAFEDDHDHCKKRGIPHRQVFDRIRITQSASSLAVANTHFAFPYSRSSKTNAFWWQCLSTCLSCQAALVIGDSQLVIRSCHRAMPNYCVPLAIWLSSLHPSARMLRLLLWLIDYVLLDEMSVMLHSSCWGS